MYVICGHVSEEAKREHQIAGVRVTSSCELTNVSAGT